MILTLDNLFNITFLVSKCVESNNKDREDTRQWKIKNFDRFNIDN